LVSKFFFFIIGKILFKKLYFPNNLPKIKKKSYDQINTVWRTVT